MKHPRWIVPVTLLSTVLATAQEPTGAEPLAARAAVAGNNEFALKLYGELRRDPGNVFFAPLSVRTALAMTWAGARGRTAAQMADVLCIAGDGDAAHRALGDLARGIRVDDAEGGAVLHTANSLWGRTGEPFLPAFLELCASRYEAGFDQLDFAGATEEARGTINAWVARQTHERIDELLKKGIIDATTVLVLTNAIDFQGTWRSRFDPKLTSDQPFWLPVAEGADAPASVDVPTMRTTGMFAYHEDDLLQAVELPYAGDALSMVVLLPRSRDGVAALEERLEPAALKAWLGALKPRRVSIHLPRFSARSAFRLDDTMQALGMTDAFGRNADFSGMNGRQHDLFISAVVHEAFVAVDEEGTEAAAATAVVMSRGSRPIPQIRADHPFLFLVRDLRTGAIVFLGRIVDPSGA